jgi:hypothetical protein
MTVPTNHHKVWIVNRRTGDVGMAQWQPMDLCYLVVWEDESFLMGHNCLWRATGEIGWLLFTDETQAVKAYRRCTQNAKKGLA